MPWPGFAAEGRLYFTPTLGPGEPHQGGDATEEATIGRIERELKEFIAHAGDCRRAAHLEMPRLFFGLERYSGTLHMRDA